MSKGSENRFFGSVAYWFFGNMSVILSAKDTQIGGFYYYLFFQGSHKMYDLLFLFYCCFHPSFYLFICCNWGFSNVSTLPHTPTPLTNELSYSLVSDGSPMLDQHFYPIPLFFMFGSYSNKMAQGIFGWTEKSSFGALAV